LDYEAAASKKRDVFGTPVARYGQLSTVGSGREVDGLDMPPEMGARGKSTVALTTTTTSSVSALFAHRRGSSFNDVNCKQIQGWQTIERKISKESLKEKKEATNPPKWWWVLMDSWCDHRRLKQKGW
jgi:hypothetical protein